ncbi:hypothetical protein CkaCkLH20_11393 [Colletotrichum karsti]|uniref:Uncharacterized protein n=1 Tax=Colletotrichum karsti TaxID=1095194 RepID=A0A9P6HVP2_9PEZI|nr:uncharacterized protein CkaCkLH20_11393 [Colletotrichum karsti]KAF9871224.1 hypothetical protein CkaCkLH20_11393 [Colletotrichum karsti]
MSHIFYRNEASHQNGSTTTDGTSTTYGIDTPSPTDDSMLPGPVETSSAPEPTVLLYEIQQAAEDISQLVGRFGYKMAQTLKIPSIKKEFFANRALLWLPCLQYADNFSCVVTKLHAKSTNYTTSAPLLWWLWDELLDHLLPAVSSRGCRLEFRVARETTIVLPYTVTINLSSKNGSDNIEFTASYGGPFHERRIFDAPITQFRFPESTRYGKSTTATLDIDQHPYEADLAHILNYLVPRQGSIWRCAMKAFPSEQEEKLVIALAGTCKAKDDRFFMSKDQENQCQNLLQRFPADAKEYIADERLVGKEQGPYSKTAFQPPGPKD